MTTGTHSARQREHAGLTDQRVSQQRNRETRNLHARTLEMPSKGLEKPLRPYKPELDIAGNCIIKPSGGVVGGAWPGPARLMLLPDPANHLVCISVRRAGRGSTAVLCAEQAIEVAYALLRLAREM